MVVENEPAAFMSGSRVWRSAAPRWPGMTVRGSWVSRRGTVQYAALLHPTIFGLALDDRGGGTLREGFRLR